MQTQSNDASRFCIETHVFIAAMTNLDAQSGLHVSPITALWRSTQTPGTCGVIASESPVAGSYLTQDESDLLRLVSKGCSRVAYAG